MKRLEAVWKKQAGKDGNSYRGKEADDVDQREWRQRAMKWGQKLLLKAFRFEDLNVWCLKTYDVWLLCKERKRRQKHFLSHGCCSSPKGLTWVFSFIAGRCQAVNSGLMQQRKFELAEEAASPANTMAREWQQQQWLPARVRVTQRHSVTGLFGSWHHFQRSLLKAQPGEGSAGAVRGQDGLWGNRCYSWLEDDNTFQFGGVAF